MAKDVNAGRAFVDLFLKDTSLTRGLALAETKIKAFGSRVSAIGKSLSGWGDSLMGIGTKIAALGSAASASLFGAAKVFADMGGSLTDMADRTGLSVEGIQELGYAAKMTGASTEDLETGVRKMQKTIAGAEEESKSAQEALAGLGIAVADLAGLNPEQQFARIADRLASIGDPTKRAAAAMEIFGKSGTKLLPMMAKGAAGLDAMRQKARELGIVLSAEDVEAGDKFGDTLDTMWQAIKVGTARVGAQLVPVLTGFANRVIEVSGVVGKWITQNQGLVVTAYKLASIVTVAGASVLAAGVLFKVAGIGLSVFGTAVSATATVAGVLVAALGFLATPLGLIVGATAAAGGALLYLSGIGGQVGDYLGNVFSTLANDAIRAFGAIGKALAAGDLSAAAKVVWALLKMEWVKGTSWILGVWAETKAGFLNIWADASAGIATMMIQAWSIAQSAWISATAAMSEAWTMFTSFVGNTWDSLTGWLKKRWIELRGLIDDTVDVVAEKEAVDRGTLESQNQRKENEAAALSAAENEARTREEGVTATKDAMLSGVAAQTAVDKQRRDNETNTQLARLLADAEAAKRAYAEAVTAANAAAPQMAGAGKPPGFNPANLDLKGAAAKSVSTAGTFSGAAAWGLGTGNVQERIAANTEKSATFSEKLAKWMISQNRPLVFES